MYEIEYGERVSGRKGTNESRGIETTFNDIKAFG